jgi:hypothetical protein
VLYGKYNADFVKQMTVLGAKCCEIHTQKQLYQQSLQVFFNEFFGVIEGSKNV